MTRSAKIAQDNYSVYTRWTVQRTAYAIVLLALIFTVHPIFAQQPVPQLWGMRVHDEARILTQGTVDKLENELKAYEDSTSNQIAILTISSLEDEPIENYSLRVVEAWKLGTEGRDNGVLLLIAVDDHKMRIETGYGLEGVLTDAMCSRIIRNEIAPAFRQNQYDEGIINGVAAIVAAIGGEYSAEDNSGAMELDTKGRILIGLFIFGVLGMFTFLGLFVPGCGGWVLYAFLIPFYAVFPMVVLGSGAALGVAVVYIIGFPILKLILGKTDWGIKMAKKMKTSGGRAGGWSSGSGWSGGGGSSGGFSGGGGSFGGGGSSGSW